MKITNKLFVPHRFSGFWCLLISIHLAIMITAAMDNIFFLSFGFISLFAFASWVQDLEAGRHNSLKKTIISILIVLTCILICIGFINSNHERKCVFVYFMIMLVINVLYLIAIIWERSIHIKKNLKH